MSRKLNPFLILLFFLLLATQVMAEVNLTKLVKKIQPAVVTVITYDQNNKVFCKVNHMHERYPPVLFKSKIGSNFKNIIKPQSHEAAKR